MGRQSKLFDRAAACERLMNLSWMNKEIFKTIARHVDSFSQRSPRMSAKELAKEINSIEAIQSGLETRPKPMLH